jgi:L(+)-tartrate dehydratase beta subunit
MGCQSRRAALKTASLAIRDRPQKSDFLSWVNSWVEQALFIIIGKGGMTSDIYRRHFVPNDAVYLTTVGYGTGALLGRGIKRVNGVYWL